MSLFPRDLPKVIPQSHPRNEWVGASVLVSSILVEVLFLIVFKDSTRLFKLSVYSGRKPAQKVSLEDSQRGDPAFPASMLQAWTPGETYHLC